MYPMITNSTIQKTTHNLLNFNFTVYLNHSFLENLNYYTYFLQPIIKFMYSSFVNYYLN
jgi:hypothetical protein